ncbi:MAG: methionyl-tRNA formyltransferase [Opitutus sp.]|nr:methionyl-tRNA formyltransferase [Opitutus sp.]
MRLVFMGSDAIALPALNWLAGEGSSIGKVVAVFTQPDRAVGRGQKIQPNAIKQWALARGLPVHQPEKFSATDRETLASYAPDLALVMAYGHILKQDVIDTPRHGTVNLHASLLPKLRGASPMQTAVASGETETGVAFMRIVAALDAGPVADLERVPIAPLDTALEVEAKMAAAGVPLLARALPRLAAGTLEFREQDHARATFCRRLEKSDGAIDFHRPAAEVAARINGLMPWPGCATEFGGQPLKIGLAETCNVIPYNSTEAGQVLGADEVGLLVACGDGAVRLRKLQRPGGKMLAAGEFLRGCPIPAGMVLPSRAMAPLISDKPFARAKN